MSQHDEENKCERSVKLCQLVYDRRIDSEIGYEIRKLLEEGILIDYQDQNRNKKTALHLAVDKCDVSCVKFLLQFRPNLDVKDGDGKTPVELATIKSDQNIINVLLNSTFDVVDESYIEVFDFEGLTRQKIESIKLRPNFKVLKLTNCPSVNEAWNKFKVDDYATALNELSHFFFILIETKETNIDNDHELMKKVLNLQRPMIVQLTSANSQNIKIYFKDDKKDFLEILDTPQMTQDQFNESIKSGNNCNMNLLIAALRSNLFGHFTADLLVTKLNTNEDRSEAGNQFAKLNALCHRFLKLFDESQPQLDRIVATLSFKGDQSLLALLDLPFEPKDKKLKLNEYQRDILDVVDSRGYNLLMMAAQLDNLDAVKLFLRCGFDFNHSDNEDNHAADICWEMKAFDSLAALIEAGSPYPYHFSADELDESSEAVKRINAMTEVVNSFHANIEDGETEEVKKFISSRPHITHAYDTKNYCALTVALQSNEVDILSLLMSEGFEPGVDDEYYTALDESKFKYEIRDSHRKYFKEAFDEPHLKRLLNKFRLSFGSKDRAKCSTIIRRMFDELNEIDELIPILQICSLSDQLRIVFDFNCNSVVDMDPISKSSALGAVYPIGGFVYIGAKNHEKDFCKVIGTLIHELTHYAMNLTYENSCKPYDDDDDDEKSEHFENVAIETKKICDENLSTDPIVSTVFKYYKEEVWHQELIVRVPQLIAHYKTNPKALKTAERNTPELFHFYREITLRDVATQTRALLQEYLISKINKQTGIARKIENLKVKFENVDDIDLKSVNVVTSNAPQLTLAILRQSDFEDSHIFVTLEQVALGNILNKIANVNSKESSTVMIVDCIGQAQKYPESLRKLLKDIKNMKKIALVMTEGESSKVKENFSKIEFKTFDHKWGELTESSKVHLLNQNVIFQRVQMKLNELVESSSEAMHFFPLERVLDCKDFKIGNELHERTNNFYIKRKFTKKNPGPPREVLKLTDLEKYHKSIKKSFEELLQNNPEMGAMIISDDAGSGKSVTLFEIAKYLHVARPDRWVLFVDLKRHIEAFKCIEDYEKIEAFEDFIVQHILKNETEFDQELFKEMFRTGKTFLLFDGFDEISPNFKDLLLHVLRLFKNGPNNFLCIASRPHLEADLEGVLGNFTYKLETFTEDTQKSFLREYWQSVALKSEEDFETLSQRLLKKFSMISASRFIGLPLLMRMTAEIFDGPAKEISLSKMDSLNVASIFKNFVNKYFEGWKAKENEIARKENVEIDVAGGILEIHHNIAIKHKFGEKFTVFEVDASEYEKMARVGLAKFDKATKTIHFIHETFAEYFVADFIRFHLERKTRNPSHDCSLAVEIFLELSSSSVNYFRITKTFLDQTLQEMNFKPNQAFYDSLAKVVNEVLKRKNYFDILRGALNENFVYLEGLLLSTIVKCAEKEVFLRILKSKSSLHNPLLVKTAHSNNNTVVTTLCNAIRTRIEDPREIFQQEDKSLGNILLNAAGNQHDGVLTTLCDSLIAVFTKVDIKAMLEQKDWKKGNILAIAASNDNDHVLLELLSLLPNYFSADELKSFFLFTGDQNYFRNAMYCRTNKNIKLLSEFVKSLLDREHQKFYFRNLLENIFHCSPYHGTIYPTLVETTRDVLSNDDFKSMLMRKDSREYPEYSCGSNVLHTWLNTYSNQYQGEENILKELGSILKEFLSDDEIRALLLEVDGSGRNCFRLASNSEAIYSQVFCETFGNFLPIEDRTRLLQQSYDEIDVLHLAIEGKYEGEVVPTENIKFLLAKRNSIGHNAFHRAVDWYNVKNWNKLVAFAQARFSNDEMKSFLINIGIENCLHAAASRHPKDMIEAILRDVKRVSSLDELKCFVRQKDYEQKNVFHRAAESTFHHAFSSIFECLSDILSESEIHEMLQQKDAAGNNIFFLSFRVNEAVKDLITILPLILSADEIKSLLLALNRKEQNFFQYAIGSNFKYEIKSLGRTIKTFLSLDEQKTLFSNKNQNIFHLAVEKENKCIITFLYECLKDVYTKNEIMALMQEKRSDGCNIFLKICQEKSLKGYAGDTDDLLALYDLFRVVKEAFDSDGLKKFISSSNNHGSNCLLLTVKFKHKTYLKELFRFIRAELKLDDQKNLIRSCDHGGNNIFKSASCNDDTEIIPFVLGFAREILPENQIEELLRQAEMK